MIKEKVVEEIRKQTDGTFIVPNHTSTLMGYVKKFDEQGREVTVDPNYKHGKINICGEDYFVTRYGWTAIVWKPERKDASYMWAFCLDKKDIEERALAIVDVKPDYVLEYEKKEEEKLLKLEMDFAEKGYEVSTLLSCDDHITLMLAHEGQLAVAEFAVGKNGKAIREWSSVKNIQVFTDFSADYMVAGIQKCYTPKTIIVR